MIKTITILFFYLLLGQAGGAQGVATRESTSGAALTARATLPVLFASNDDCRLFIEGESMGMVTREKFLYLSLAPGSYRYIAKSRTTGDEWRDTFSVAPGRPAEVFIDMLYTSELAAAIQNNSEASRTASAAPGGRKSPSAAGTPATADAKERERAAISQLIASMLPVQGGTYVMGNNKSPAADEAEHPVLVSQFYIGRYEVTQEQWEAIMGSNPSFNKGCADCPVESVSWEEVMVFLRKLNSVSARRFRLPTEAEWEYVAKMGGKAEIDKAGGHEAFIRKSAWAFVNSDNKTHPVGKKLPVVSGLYDLHGNVSEWCADWYGAFFYKENFTEKDPEGPPLGREKIVRGGNYKDFSGDRFRPSFRNKMNPKAKSSAVGFRLVMEWPE